ncbi:hypothetical protein E8E13_000002, partial [Curvularia kusanoi]
MVHYPLPRYIRRNQVNGTRPYRWSAEAQRADIAALRATCTRCVQTIAKQRERCNKPGHRRCGHCARGNRGGCTLVPDSLNGRVARLYQLRDRYDAAVTAAATPRTDANVARTG